MCNCVRMEPEVSGAGYERRILCVLSGARTARMVDGW